MNNNTKRTIAATMILPAALAVAGSALVIGCPTDASPNPEQPKSFTVSISGTAKIGQELTANVNRDAGVDGAATYDWKRNGVAISGATASTYTLVDADEGAKITVTVTIDGTGSKTSAATATVAPQYANLNSYGSVKIENRSTYSDGIFTNQAFSYASMAKRINDKINSTYSSITKVIIGNVNKKVGTVLTIDVADFVNAASTGALTTTIQNALSNANANPQAASAKSLNGVRLAGLQPKNPFDGLLRESKKATLQRGNRIVSSQSRQRLG